MRSEQVHHSIRASVKRYSWRNRHSQEPAEPGFMIEGSKSGYAWISADDAWVVAERLADFLDQDAEKGRA